MFSDAMLDYEGACDGAGLQKGFEGEGNRVCMDMNNIERKVKSRSECNDTAYYELALTV